MDDIRKALAGLDSIEAPDLWPAIERRASVPESAAQSPEWTLQPMSSSTRLVTAGAIVALFGGLLLAGVLTQQPGDESMPAARASVSASPPDAGAMDPSLFALRLTVGGWYGTEIDPDTGFTAANGIAEAIPRDEWEAVSKDELFGGPIDMAQDADPRAVGVVTEVWVQEGRMPCCGGEVIIGRRSTRIENDGGAWVGRATVPSIGVGPVIGTSFWELVGEGGYEGLTMFLWGDFRHHPELLHGIIVPSDNVPDFPPPPGSGAAGES